MANDIWYHVFRYLGLKDQVRAGGVNKTFRSASEHAIKLRKSLLISDSQFSKRFTPQSLQYLLGVCGETLEQIEFEWYGDDYAYIDVFNTFKYPKLIAFKCGVVAKQGIVDALLTNNRQLKSLTVAAFMGNASYPNITSENLETLNCERCWEKHFRSLTGRVPNLKHFQAALMDQCPVALDQFLSTVSNLESLKITAIGNYAWLINLEREAMAGFWQLKKLEVLEISNHNLDNVSDIGFYTVVKMASSFPDLRVLSLPADKVTNSGLAELKRLTRLKELTLEYNSGSMESTFDPSTSIRELVGCRGLQKLRLTDRWGNPSPVSVDLLIELFRSCRYLSEVSLWDLRIPTESPFDQDATAAEVVGVVNALAVVGPNRIITINTDETTSRDIWRSEEVKGALENLNTNHRVKLEFPNQGGFG